jgi:hypothetical protein
MNITNQKRLVNMPFMAYRWLGSQAIAEGLAMRLSKTLRRRHFYSVPAAGKQVGHSRAEAYRAAQRGDIPTIKDGRFLLVPRKQWNRIKEQILHGLLPRQMRTAEERANAAKAAEEIVQSRREREAENAA